MTSVILKRFITYSKYSRFREIQRLKYPVNRSDKSVVSFSTSTGALHEDDNVINEEEEADVHGALYQGHRPTNMFQKVLLTAGSAAMSLYNPARGDMIATLGDVTGYPALKYMKKKMEEDPVGRQILEEQPVINTNSISVEYLGSLPDNTFGKEYWRFLSKHGFSPDARLPVHYVDDPDLVYVMLRYRQCHDLFHAILGMKPNMLGEVAVKWVEAIQNGLPMCALGAVFGPLRLGPKHRQKYMSTYLPWALRNGRNSKFLMAIYFEKHWERDLQELRNELNIEPPPDVPYPDI